MPPGSRLKQDNFSSSMGRDKRKSRKKFRAFSFAPPIAKTPKDLAAYISNLLKQHKMATEVEHNDINRQQRRILRNALQRQDTANLKAQLQDGLEVNMQVDDAFGDTPLMFAVKHTYLEVVETLVNFPGCNLDAYDRNKHTPLDEAIKVWLIGGGILENEQHRGKRFRVLRSILAAGGSRICQSFIDGIIYSCHNSKCGMAAIQKLIRVVCLKGQPKVKSAIFSILLSYNKMSSLLRQLLASYADLSHLSKLVLSCHTIPEDNAIILIKATNETQNLQFVEQYLNIPSSPGDHQHRSAPRSITLALVRGQTTFKHYESIRLLLLSGYVLKLQTMHYLYKQHAGLYISAINSVRQPRPLKCLTRVSVRKMCAPNVFATIADLKSIPESVKPFLLFE